MSSSTCTTAFPATGVWPAENVAPAASDLKSGTQYVNSSTTKWFSATGQVRPVIFSPLNSAEIGRTPSTAR